MSKLVVPPQPYCMRGDPAFRSGDFCHSPLWVQLQELSGEASDSCRLLALEQTLVGAGCHVPAEQILGRLFLVNEDFSACARVGEYTLRTRLVASPFTRFLDGLPDELPALEGAIEVCEEYLALVAKNGPFVFPYQKLDADFSKWPAVRAVMQDNKY